MENNGVSIVIVVWNQLGYTRLAVESIIKMTKPPYEIVIVDNGSRPEIRAYFDTIARIAPVKYLRNEINAGPIRGINQGIIASKYPYVAVMHNDVVIFEEDWLGRILSVMRADSLIGIAALAGRKEIFSDGCVNENTLVHNLLNEEDLPSPMKEDVCQVAVVDGLCFVLSRGLLDKIDGLDESYGYMHCYDLDISLQSIAAGFKNVVVRIEAIHVGNGGRTRNMKSYKTFVKDDYGLLKKNYKIFAKKWSHMLPLKIS